MGVGNGPAATEHRVEVAVEETPDPQHGLEPALSHPADHGLEMAPLAGTLVEERPEALLDGELRPEESGASTGAARRAGVIAAENQRHREKRPNGQ